MYKKDFEKWSEVKMALENRDVTIRAHKGEIWWCAIGVNVGHEVDGKNEGFVRPVLILKKYPNNCFFVVPLTTTTRENSFLIPIYSEGKIVKASIAQVRVISHKRLLSRQKKLRANTWLSIKNQIKNML
jgi:mRNA interferase MazF